MNPLTIDEIKQVAAKINKRTYDYEAPFLQKVDQILDQSEGKHVETVLNEAFTGLLAQVDREIEEMESELGVRPSCALGCDHCCYFPIIVTRLEVKLMLKVIKGWPAERRQRMAAQIDGYLTTYQAELAELVELDFRENPAFKERYKQKNLPCIMLDQETRTCMAYEIRPIPCRTYLNYASPHVCQESHVPAEPLSYEFLYPFYVGGMAEVLAEILEVVEDSALGFSYPQDAAEVHYLPLLLQEEWRGGAVIAGE
ncbi:YkgJ family cysteine cluster protein [Halalkalibacter oceani]|uniref:YkgJ family cysteine cluster protein n=1 Tax=Halalkalibacter oceani TaxID=1653776 RepID=UPI00339B55BC